MKQIHLSWLLMAAAVITACEKERVVTESPVEKTSYVYSVKATISSETRTDYDADGKFSWTAGDQISVLFNDGENNKFFTLTAKAAGATTTFSGSIDAGYTIGATDGTADDLKIWALYPASENHAYSEGSAPTFYVQPSVDFTTVPFSANLPMFDLLSEEGEMSFKNLTCNYKFIVKDLDAAVKKVQFTIYNQTTYGLSGSWPIVASNDTYIAYDWASPGSAKSTLSFTSNVSNGQAIFYVPCRFWGTFQPAISIYDAETGFCLKEFLASKEIPTTSHNHMTTVQPITLSVPTKPFVPAIKIDGDLSDWDSIDVLPSSQTSRIREWKFKSDEQFVYFYFSLRKNRSYTGKHLVIGFNTDNDENTGFNYDTSRILGLETQVSSDPFTNASGEEPVCVNGFDSASTVKIDGGSSSQGIVFAWGYDTGEPLSSDSSSTFLELSIPRDKLNLPAAGATITIGCSFDYYVTGTQSIVLE